MTSRDQKLMEMFSLKVEKMIELELKGLLADNDLSTLGHFLE